MTHLLYDKDNTSWGVNFINMKILYNELINKLKENFVPDNFQVFKLYLYLYL